MAITSFDTLAYSEDMQKAGFTREQADALARNNALAFRDMVDTQQLATKQDIGNVKLEIEAVRREIQDVKHEILKWVIGIMIAQTTITLTGLGIVVAILK